MDKWIRNPKVVYILALMLSVLLWLVVHMEDQQNNPTVVAETDRSKEITNVSITVEGLDEEKFDLKEINPEFVRLRVTGLTKDIAKVTPQNAKVRLDLSKAVSGKQTVMLEPVGFPDQVDVTIEPSSVSVTIEEKLTREMPVMIELEGKPAEGMVAGTPIVLDTNSVYVTTPESDIDGVEMVKGIIDLDGAKETFRKQIKLLAYNKDGEVIDVKLEPSVVEVEVPITLPSKTVPFKVRLNGSLAPGFSIAAVEQVASDIVLYGNQAVLDEIEFYDGGVVDITNLDADRTFALDIPLAANLSKIEPAKAEVKLRIVPAVKRTFEQVKLTLSGQNDRYAATIMNPQSGTVNLTIEGAPEIVEGIDVDNILLIVDVGNLSVGSHKVNVSYSLPAYVRVVEDSPLTVDVDIKEIAVEQNGLESPSAE